MEIIIFVWYDSKTSVGKWSRLLLGNTSRHVDTSALIIHRSMEVARTTNQNVIGIGGAIIIIP